MGAQFCGENIGSGFPAGGDPLVTKQKIFQGYSQRDVFSNQRSPQAGSPRVFTTELSPPLSK